MGKFNTTCQFYLFGLLDFFAFIVFIVLFSTKTIDSTYKSAYVVVFYGLNFVALMCVLVDDALWSRKAYWILTTVKVFFCALNLPIFVFNLN